MPKASVRKRSKREGSVQPAGLRIAHNAQVHLHAKAQVAEGDAAALPPDGAVGLQLRDEGVDVPEARLQDDVLSSNRFHIYMTTCYQLLGLWMMS